MEQACNAEGVSVPLEDLAKAATACHRPASVGSTNGLHGHEVAALTDAVFLGVQELRVQGLVALLGVTVPVRHGGPTLPPVGRRRRRARYVSRLFRRWGANSIGSCVPAVIPVSARAFVVCGVAVCRMKASSELSSAAQAPTRPAARERTDDSGPRQVGGGRRWSLGMLCVQDRREETRQEAKMRVVFPQETTKAHASLHSRGASQCQLTTVNKTMEVGGRVYGPWGRELAGGAGAAAANRRASEGAGSWRLKEPGSLEPLAAWNPWQPPPARLGGASCANPSRRGGIHPCP